MASDINSFGVNNPFRRKRYNFQQDVNTLNTPVYNNQYAGANNVELWTPQQKKVFNDAYAWQETNKALRGRQSSQPEMQQGASAGAGWIDKAMAGVSGVGSLVNNFMDLSGIGDTSSYWNDINEIGSIGRDDYTDFDQLSQDYARMASLGTNYDYEDIRGKNDGELAMGVGNSMLQGAMTGMQIGGTWGVLAGGAIGLGTGLAGVFTGNAKARREQQFLSDSAQIARDRATRNLNAGHEQLMDYQFRSGVSNRAAWGGIIERKPQDIREFADRVLNSRRRNDTTRSSGFIRKHCNGGTMIRIKR